MVIICVCSLIIAFVLFGIIYGIYVEKHDFNNGYCPRCGEKLKHFDTDSQGGRGYWCSDCRYFVWVSYDIVDKKYKSYGKDKHNSIFKK